MIYMLILKFNTLITNLKNNKIYDLIFKGREVKKADKAETDMECLQNVLKLKFVFHVCYCCYFTTKTINTNLK